MRLACNANRFNRRAISTSGADPGEVKWVNFHPPPPPAPRFFLNHADAQTATPQPGFGSITLLQKFTPHFKILDPRLNICLISFTEHRFIPKLTGRMEVQLPCFYVVPLLHPQLLI